MSSKVIGKFTGKCCDANVSNNNDMFLGKELFDNLFASEDYKNGIENGYYIGFLGHPEDPGCMDFEHACIVMKECHMDDNGEIFGTFDLIDTPVGRVVKSFIDAGVKFGISIRGAGDVDGEGEVDPETFVFRGFDLVTFPAYNDAVPEFQEIAASSDIKKQAKYKKVCKAINKDLTNINSCEALDVMKEQFSNKSAEYNKITKRQSEILSNSNVSLDAQRLNGVIDLYLESVKGATDRELAMKDAIKAESKLLDRKLNSMKRIFSSQINSLVKECDYYKDRCKKLVASRKTLVAANTRLKAQVEDTKDRLHDDNLTYKQEIKANTALLDKKDAKIADQSDLIHRQKATIDSLESKLRKTVTANSELKDTSSNLDADLRDLESRVEAAEDLLLEYQKAYANMYANALGTHIEDLQVTANMSVSELQNMIKGGTNTANMSTAVVEPHPVEIIDSDEDEEDMIIV